MVYGFPADPTLKEKLREHMHFFFVAFVGPDLKSSVAMVLSTAHKSYKRSHYRHLFFHVLILKHLVRQVNFCLEYQKYGSLLYG